MNTELTNMIRRGEIDINNQSLFFSILIKGLIQQLKKDISIRGEGVPHYILSTGDDTMYLAVKGQDASKEPLEITNENFVTSSCPKCLVEPKGINLIPDQLTSPHAQGQFQLDHDNEITSFVAEFRRFPLTLSVDLNYYLSSYTDTLELIQQIITKLSFIRTFSIVYLGQHIKCSYVVPETFDPESNIQIDGTTTDNKDRKVSLSLTIETCLPVYDVRTVIQSDHYIRNIQYKTNIDDKLESSKIIVSDRDKTIEYLEKKIDEYKTKDLDLAEILRTILRKINKEKIYE